jgi:hypothetical protein
MINKVKPGQKLLLLSFLLLIFWQGKGQDDFSKTIGRNSEVTYLDLLRQIFPDIAKDGTAHKTAEIRTMIDSDESASYEQAMKILPVQVNWINTEKGQRLLLTIKVEGGDSNDFTWGELNLIALYTGDKRPRLLDVVDVSADRENYYWGQLPVHPRMSLTVYHFSHLNAGEDFHAYSFFYAKNDKIQETLKEFPLLYTGSTCQSRIDETGKFSAVRDPKSDYRDIVFKVKVTGRRLAKDCDTVKSKTVKNFLFRMTWQNGTYRFADGGAELKRLRREEKRLGFDNNK